MSEKKKVHCPVCRVVQKFLVVVDGELRIDGPQVVVVTGYKCQGCGRIVQWKVIKREHQRSG